MRNLKFPPTSLAFGCPHAPTDCPATADGIGVDRRPGAFAEVETLRKDLNELLALDATDP